MCAKNNDIIDVLVSIMLSTNEREVRTLKNKLHRLIKATENPHPVTTQEIAERVLTDIGVPRSICGFNYCVDAILFINKTGLQGVTTHIYKHVANIHCTTSPAVERGIRVAARLSTMNCPKDLHYIIFGNTIPASKDTPTNKAFLHSIAHYVKTLKAETA